MTHAKHKLERRIRSLKEDPKLSEENRSSILSFLDECATEGLSPIRQVKYIYMLTAIASRLAPPGFCLPRASEVELKQVVAAINRSEYADPTQVDLKNALKKYYRVLNGGTPDERTAFIKARVKKATPVTRDHIFTQEEVRAAVSALRNIRDRAFVMVLYETGARPTELLRCRICDVQFSDAGDSVFLSGIKDTPDRTNALVESGIILREWLRFHPCGGNPYKPKDPTAPLWVKLEQTNCRNCGVPSQFHKVRGCDHFEPLAVEMLRYDSIRLNFKRACLKAQIKKERLTLYSLRHTRITEMSQFMSNQQLCKFAGWCPGSGQFEVYVHLTNDDVNSAIRNHFGIGPTEDVDYKHCGVCGHRNLSTAHECRSCLRPLTPEGATKTTELREAVSQLARLAEEGKLDTLIDLCSRLSGDGTNKLGTSGRAKGTP